MALSRFVGIVDLGVATIVLVAVALPAREMYAMPAQKGTDADQFTLALAEARTIAQPSDGMAVSELSRRLDDANFKDWAVETAVRGADRAKGSPTAWRALLAASVAYVDQLEVVPAFDYANRALNACHDAQAGTSTACPTWEEIRMRLYEQHLDAGIKSGIDPHKDPTGFRRAGESALRTIHLNNDDRTGPSTAPVGSGSAGAGSAGSAGSASGSDDAPGSAGSAQP